MKGVYYEFSDEEKDKYSTSFFDRDMDNNNFKVECYICHDKTKMGWSKYDEIMGIGYYICEVCGGVNIIE